MKKVLTRPSAVFGIKCLRILRPDAEETHSLNSVLMNKTLESRPFHNCIPNAPESLIGIGCDLIATEGILWRCIVSTLFSALAGYTLFSCACSLPSVVDH